MTQTAKELLKDRKFLLKRIREQHNYIRTIWTRFASCEKDSERFILLYNSANYILDNLQNLLDKLDEKGK